MTWHEEDDIDASPRKQMIQAIIAGTTNKELLNEIFDNALDSAGRTGKDSVDVNVRHFEEPDQVAEEIPKSFPVDSGSGDVLKIEDSGGGVDDENIDVLVTLGESIAGGHNSIGVFGIGLKAALIKLANMAAVHTRAEDSSTSHMVVVPEDWENEEGWDAKHYRNDNPEIDEGKTEIFLFNLNFDFDNVKDELVDYAGGIYAKQLRDNDYMDLSLDLDGETVTPPSGIDWAYTPFYFYPRKYPEIEINPDDRFDEPVYLTATIGYTRDNETGTDVYCQGRRILHTNQGREGGWGPKNRGLLGEITDDSRRLRLVLEFDTHGDKTNLPWGENKASIEPDSSVFREAIGEIQSKVKNYHQIGSTLRKPLLEPYGADSQMAYNGGEVVEYDSYSDVDKPTRAGEVAKQEHRKRINNLVDYANAHGTLGIYCYDVLEFEDDEDETIPDDLPVSQLRKPGYERIVDKKADIESPQVVDEVPPEVRETADGRKSTLKKKAHADARKGRYDKSVEEKDWANPIYQFHLQKTAEEPVEDLDNVWCDFWETGEDSENGGGNPNGDQDDGDDENGGGNPNGDQDDGDDENGGGNPNGNQDDEGEENSQNVPAQDSIETIFPHTPMELDVEVPPSLMKGLRESLDLDPDSNKDRVEKELTEAIVSIAKLSSNQNS